MAGARRYPNAVQSWANGAQAAAAFAGVAWDVGGYTTGQPAGYFRVPVGHGGLFLVEFGEQVDGVGAVVEMYAELDVNGVAVRDAWRAYAASPGLADPSIEISAQLILADGDIVHGEAYQRSGAARNGSSGDYFGLTLTRLGASPR